MPLNFLKQSNHRMLSSKANVLCLIYIFQYSKKMPPTCSKLTGHCWHSPVDLSNKTPPHISRWAGWSVCSIKSHYPPQPPGHSYRTLPSRSSRGGRSGTSEPPAGFDKMADRGGSRMTGVEPAALEERMTPLSLPLWCTSPGSPTSPQDLVPMETTGSHSSLCSPASSSSPFLLSLLTCYMIQWVWMLLKTFGKM